MTVSLTKGSVAATAEQIAEAQDWAADCMNLPADCKPSAEYAMAYVERDYPGGWSAFVEECCTFVQL